MGPPGSFRQENAIQVSEAFQWRCISVGDLMRREVTKKTEVGKKITEAFKEYRFGKCAP